VFARILLAKPMLLFLDEATSALDESAETRLLGLLRTKSWRPTIVSVGHGATLRKFHDQVVDLAQFRSQQEAAATHK
jgi:putative ATP-binding cassette transporter